MQVDSCRVNAVCVSLSIVDYQRHELRKDTTTSRDVPDRANSCSSLNDCDNNSSVDDLVVVNGRRKSAKVQVVSARKPFSSPLSKSVVDFNAPRSQPDTLREPSSIALPCGQVAVIGSSSVRGVSLGLNNRGVDAVTFTYLPRLWGTADDRADQWHSDEDLPTRYCSLKMRGKWFAK